MTGKKLITPFLSLLFLSFFCHAYSQIRTEVIEGLFSERNEVYFSFEKPGEKELLSISGIVSIDRPDKSDEITAYANRQQFSNFLELGIEYKILTQPSMLYPATMKSEINIKEVYDWDFYPTYDAYVSMMYQFQADYPGLCEVISIGQSNQGRELLVAKISDNISQAEGEPRFLYTSSMHGDETTGYVLMLRLINYLLSNYGTLPKVDNLVNNMEIWINPLANPDGTYAAGNNTVNGAIRFNSMGVDLNRNYPDPEDGPHPDGNPWQTETLHFMQMAEDYQFVSAANFHGGAEVCNYPWDTWAQLHADDAWWQYVCHEYADTAQQYSPPGYMSGFNDGITNGYQWYTTAGNRQDYMNYFHQCREFICEISDVKLLPANQLPAHWEYNYRSLLNYMEQSLNGIKGTVTNANTGEPVYAQVFVENHDIDSSMVFTDESSGNYFRPIYTGTYDLTFSAFGYFPQTIQNVTAVNGQLTQLDVQLIPGDLIVDFVASATNIPIGSTIDFTDITFGNAISWDWAFEGGTPSTSAVQNPQNILYSDEGIYDVSLTVSDGTNTITVTKQDYISVSVEFVMQNSTVNTCSGVFYDSGGSSGNYSNNENFTMTFLPALTGSKIIVEFTSFSIEDEADCDYDWLKIYDGPTTSATLIGEYCGNNSPGTIVASNNDGALTFSFHSDGSVTGSGWVAAINCETTVLPPLADFTASYTTLFEGGSIEFTDLSLNEPTSWIWGFEGGTPGSSTEQNPVVMYETPGLYDVLLVVQNSAGTNSMVKEDYILVESLTGIGQDVSSIIKFYPNPANDHLILESLHSWDNIRIYNLLGESVKSFSPRAIITKMNISDLVEGTYIVELSSSTQKLVKKIEVLR